MIRAPGSQLRRVLIVDDEPPARAKLTRFIAELEDFEVVGEAASVEDATRMLGSLRPDVLYLDIQLGTRNGFEIVETFRGRPAPLVVFTTAYSEHAVRAFEVQALDYLLKPFDRDRFLACMERVRTALREPERSDVEMRLQRLLAALPGGPVAPAQILIHDGERAFFVRVADIDRVAAAGNYVEVHAAGKVHLVRDSLAAFVAPLDPTEFLRVHRSHVVRLGFIAELRPMFHGDYEILLRDGQTVTLSRRYKLLLPAEMRARL